MNDTMPPGYPSDYYDLDKPKVGREPFRPAQLDPKAQAQIDRLKATLKRLEAK